MQLDQKEKGFSFLREGPLDMRMDGTRSLTARQIVNEWSEKNLGELFREYGEDPRWRRAAKAIVESRRRKPLTTTTQLAELLTQALPGKTRGKLHPATLVFQALRILVNDELGVLQEALNKAIAALSIGGRLGVISFHSLEDRLVKNCFRMAASSRQPDGTRVPALVKILTKKPIVPSLREMRSNPRSRSAKMRFVEKIDALSEGVL